MRSKLPTRIDVVKKEEKEAHLVAFIRSDLDAARAQQPAGAAQSSRREFTLVLRSLASPVAGALVALASELSAAKVSLRMVIAQPVLGADNSLFNGPAAALLPLVSEARVLRDIRFLDAHEQLRLDSSATWIGDCMRREPGKRDAYESYSAEDDDMACWAAVSFERLWGHAVPCFSEAPAVDHDVPPEVCPAALVQGETLSPVEAATRH